MEFHFSTVLGVIHGRNLSGETTSLIGHILDCEIREAQVLDNIPHCREYLKEQFPNLNTKDIISAFAELDIELEKDNQQSCNQKITCDWLKKIFPLCNCTEKLQVKPKPHNYLDLLKTELGW